MADPTRLPPWKRRKKKPGRGARLSPEQVAAARKRAESAGRRYPNLVNNMWAARLKPGELAPHRDPDNFDPDG